MAQTRILLAEDESIVARDIERRLVNAGYGVTAVVFTGEEALGAAEKTTPDLVLMDIALKGDTDGVTTAGRIQERFDIPVVYLTAHSDSVTLQRARVTDPFGYLLKPFEERELITVIELALHKYQVEKELRIRERWLSTVLTSIGDAVVATDIQGCVTFMNPVAEVLTDWPFEEAKGKTTAEVLNLISEDARDSGENPIKGTLQEEGTPDRTTNALLIARDGTQTPITTKVTPIQDEKGDITGTVFTFHDITQQVQAEAQRDEQQRMLRTLVDALPDPTMFRDRELKYVVCNKAFCDFYELSEQDIIGKTDLDILSRPEDAQRFQEEDRVVLETGRTIIDRHLTETPRGLIWTESVKAPLRNENGDTVGVVAAARDITDRIRVSAERDEQRLMLRTLVDALPDVVHFKDRDLRYVVCNKTFCDFYDTREEEIVGKTDFDILSRPEDAEFFKAKDLQVLETGQTLVEKHRTETPQGFVWDESIRAPLRDEQGEIIGVVAASRDITGRVQAEKSLQNSEERYRNLVENMDDMVYTLDIEGRLTYVSPAVEQISGYAPEELTGRHFGEFVHPDDLPTAAANFGIAEENQSVHLELRILSKDGSVINVRSSGRPLFERGERIGVSGILSNITEQVKAETERDEQRRMLRAVLDTLSDFIIFKDKESVFRVCNQAFCDFMGLPEEEIMGKTDFDLFPPENAQSYRDEELQVMESEQTAINIHRLEGPDGIHWDEAIKTPLRNEQGEIIGVLTAGRDITDRMQAEAERDEQQRMLRALLDATPDFVIFKDRESVFRACSERHRQSLGPDTPMDQYLGQSDVDIFPEEEAQRYREEEVHVMETGKHLMAEHLLETSDGPCWVEAVKMPLRNEQGEIVGVFSCERDITERKQYEGSLARRAREMTALYETSLEINAQQDVPTLLTDIIRRAADLVGVTTGGLYLMRPDGETLELVVSYNLMSDYTGTTLRLGEGLSGRVAQTGEPMMVPDHRTWVKRAAPFADGPFRRVLGVPLRAGNRVIGVLNVTDTEQAGLFEEEDIRLISLFADQAAIALENARLSEATQHELTERKRAEEALRRERDFTASVLDTTEALVNVKDTKGRFLMFNRKCEEVSGYAEEEVLGRVLWEFLVSPEDVERVQNAVGRWPEHPPPTYHENPWLTKDGRRIPLVWRNSVLPGETPDQALLIGSGLDISERVAHEREIKQSNRELTVLYETLRAASTSLDPKMVFRRVVHALAEAGSYRFVSAYMLEGGKLRLCEQVGYTQNIDNIDPSTGVLGRLLRTGEPQFVSEPIQDPDFISLGLPLTGEVCVPVKLDDEVVGVLNIETSDTANPLTETDLKLMSAIADQLSLVMYNARLYRYLDTERQRMQQSNEELLTLQQISTAVISHLNLTELLNSVAQSATELLQGDSGSIFLFDQDDSLTIHGSYSLNHETVRDTPHEFGQNITDIVTQTGEPVIVTDVPADPRFDSVPANEEDLLSMISTPLLSGKSVVGTLNVHSSTRRQAFDEGHLHILSLLANQATVAIENARLYSATAESEVRYRSLFEGALDGIIVVDVETGYFLEANPAFQRMLGYSQEELRQRTVWDVRAQNDQEAVRRFWLEFIDRGAADGRLIPYQCKDGNSIEAEFVAQVIEWGGRQVEVAIIHDVTEKLRLEEQLRQSQKMEAIGTLAGGIAHDFNNLLGSVLGYASFVKDSLAADDPARADLEVIERSARRGADLTRQLLAFARGGRYEVRPLSVNAQVKEVAQLLSRTVDKSIAINPVLDDKAALIEGDAGQINQLLLNLCLNACEAMAGGGFLTVETKRLHLDAETARRQIGKEGAGDYTLLTVSDTGHGMEPDVLEHVFEPFFSTKKGQSGKKHSGLGLATVFGIVKGHNGAIRVESAVGQGTTFKVWLPADVDLLAEADIISKLDVSGGSETVLIVDDEASLRNMFDRVLSAAGYRVLLAAGGTEALEIFESEAGQIDLVVLDMIMPEMNGATTFRHLRELDPSVCVLLSSGYSDQGQAQDILTAGAKGFIQKPFSFQDILSKVRTLLDERES